MKTLSLTRCPTCSSPERSPAPLGLLRCTGCGTVYAAEYADPDEVFRAGYLSGGTGDFGIDVSHPRFQAYLAAVGARRCALVEGITGVRGGTWLDVGCGSGELLAAAVARGWRAAGAEPLADASARARSRGLDVRTGLVEDTDLPRRAWDVVSAFHVLEHVPSAADFLGLLAGYARPGGCVVIESPNFDAVARGRYGEGWMHLRRLEHLVHWAPGSLRAAFLGAGLEPVAVRTPSWLYAGHTLAEALEVLGRPQWARGLGRPGDVPRAPVRALLRAAEAVHDRAGRGAVVLGVARVPAGS